MSDHLDHDHLARTSADVEYHPLRPFLPEEARVLFLGSFPPARKRWCMDFYYPNFINDHWRIEGEVFYADRHHFVDTAGKRFRLDDIVAHCTRMGLAFYDTSVAVRRLKDNASDKYLEVVEPTDVRALMALLPLLRGIITTGEKATQTLCAQLGIEEAPQIGASVSIPGSTARLYRLPSSSRAYPLAFEKKVAAYKQVLSEILNL